MQQNGYYCEKGRLKRAMQRLRYSKRVWHIVIFFTAMYLPFCSSVPAMDTTFELATGYDDNVAEVTEAEGSGMVQYRAQFAQSLLKEKTGPEFDLFLDAVYSQYFDFENNFQVRLGTELSTAPFFDRFRAGMFVEAVAYRDDLVAEDEYNTLLVGGNIQWLATARLTLSLRQTFSKVDYQNSVSLPGQRIYTVDMGKGKGSGGHETIVEDEWITLSQEDSVSATEMMATYAMGPDFQTDLSFLYRDSSSSNDYETYQEIGGYAKITWFCTESLEVFVSGYLSTLDYETAPEGIDRSDDIHGASLGGNWWMGSVKLFVQVDRTENDSPISGEDYQKSVALCGVSYTF